MPYKRNRKRNARKSRKPFTKNQMKTIMKLSSMSGELKQKTDSEADTSVTATSGFIHDVSDFAIVQGDGDDERIGDKIKIKDIQWKLRVKPGSAGYDITNGHTYRIYVIQVNGDLNGSAVLRNINPMSFFPRQEDADGLKYKILYSKVCMLNPDVTNNKFHSLSVNAKRLLKNLTFDDGASTVSLNPVKLYLSPVTTTADQLSVDCEAKIRYYDS